MRPVACPRLPRLAPIAAALCLLLAPAHAAELKVAIVNLRGVFDGYWKTKQADIQMRDRASDFEKTRKGMVDEYQRATEEYRKLNEGASDAAASPDEKEKQKKSAEGKFQEMREIEQNIAQLDKTRDSTLGDQRTRLRNRILGEIREVIAKKAKDGNYNLVLDSSADSFNNTTQVILYTSGTPDLSEELLTQLNSTAPAGAITGSEKPDEGKDSKDSKDSDKKDNSGDRNDK
jgi:outer membrane protein